ncbi:MAG: lipopolysaccharide heptosyltransferase II [Xanthobacteraceae bacterium]|uniref:lipopolysaccharide heptosyltransferase II n=1 Tax=Pseudolabrys sp. TaxID=1960880 RepID=UPI003D0D5297
MTNDPVLIIPYMWIGDFVRCHSVVRVLRAQEPERPVDVLSTSLCAPLADYMPGVRKAIVVDLPRGRLAMGMQRELAARLKAESYGQTLVMPRTWKAALAPWLAGIPARTGFVGEMRFGLLNDVRWGEKKLPRMIDQCAALALPKDEALPDKWPVPQLIVPAADAAQWRARNGLGSGPAVAMAPGAVGPSKRWPASYYSEVAKQLTAKGIAVWVIGGPGERTLADEIVGAAGARARNLTGTDLRNAILALKAATAAASNDSGLVHVAAAIGTPTIGIFGPTSAWHWAPLNPLAATIETLTYVDCRPCHKPVCRVLHHRCMRDIPPARVLAAAEQALAEATR